MHHAETIADDLVILTLSPSERLRRAIGGGAVALAVAATGLPLSHGATFAAQVAPPPEAAPSPAATCEGAGTSGAPAGRPPAQFPLL